MGAIALFARGALYLVATTWVRGEMPAVECYIGQLNQVVHMWRYSDLNDRAARRAALAADPGWAEYLAQGAPLIQHMENKILSPAPFYDG